MSLSVQGHGFTVTYDGDTGGFTEVDLAHSVQFSQISYEMTSMVLEVFSGAVAHACNAELSTTLDQALSANFILRNCR